MSRNGFRALAGLAALLAVALIAMPALGVDPSRSPSTGAAPSAAPSGAPKAASSAEPAEVDEDGQGSNGQGNGNGNKPDKAAKAEKSHAPEHPVTLTGVVKAASGEEGGYTLTVGSTVYELSAGPKWWWGDANPLAKAVGKTVKIDGEQEEGSTEVDVLAIDGTAIRAAGKPPWAGGWKVVGPKHPGWAQWKVDKAAQRDAAKAEKGNGPPPWAGPKSPEPSPGS